LALLLIFSMVIITYQIAQLFWNVAIILFTHIRDEGLTYGAIGKQSIAAMFFGILLMLEIMQTLKVYSEKHTIKVRIILIVCLISVGQRVIEIGMHGLNAMEEFGLASVLLALAISYYLINRSDTTETQGQTTVIKS